MMNTFTFTPSWGSALTKKYAVTDIAFGDGYSQRVGEGINRKREMWQLKFTVVDETTAAAIEAFLDGESGVTGFLWTPPGRSQIVVTCQEFSKVYNDFNNAVISCVFRQEFEPTS